MTALLVALGVYSREGGMERFNRRLVTCLGELRESGVLVEASVLALWDTAAEARAAPPSVDFIPGQSRKIRTVLSFLSLLIRRRFDVILYGHVLLAPLLLLGWIFSRRTRQAILVHGVEVWSRPNPFRRWVARHLADEVIAVSAFTARRMADAYGLPTARFRLLPNAVDLHRFQNPNAAPPFALRGQHRLLSVSRLSPADVYKNVDRVILALPSILASFPDTHYYVVGDGAWRPSLETLALSIGVSRHVHFLGRVDDATRDALYRHSHIFVLPSTKEGFGIAFLEAWSFRLPVIASNRDAATEVIRHDVDGLCIDPRPARIADAVCLLLADAQRRGGMGKAGYDRLCERYTHDRFRQTMHDLLMQQTSCAA